MSMEKGIIFLLFFALTTVSGSKCPTETISRFVVCYYKGETPMNNLNICNCTHLIFTNGVHKMENSSLEIKEDAKKDLEVVKERKEDIVTLFTLEAKEEESSSFLKSENRSQELINGVAAFLQNSQFDGVELNFKFTSQDGASKDSFASFVKSLSKTLSSTHRRVKREGYDVFESVQDDVTTTSYSTLSPKNSTIKAPSLKQEVVKSNSRTTREEKGESLEDSDDNDFLTLEDEITTTTKDLPEEEEENKEEDENSVENTNKFLVFVRLSIQPEIVAKKFDLKLLSKYVDALTVPTHNIVNKNEEHLTYHPSRLMGLSDILNTDSILDFLTGMGALKSKIIITIPATVLKFQLKDESKNTPRSPSLSAPQLMDQSQLCSLFSKNNWTLERDEDLTAPYAYSGKTWLAFEDEVSVKIKGKYILLRELAGGAIFPIDADVNDESCTNRTGTGGFLTGVLFNNFKNLGRKPRALVLESLQDEIHDNSFSTIEAGVKLSEYRIVRVVDHSGAVHVIRKNTKTQFECSRQGYFSHPLGCNKFYRCVKFDQYSDEFTVFEYNCPAGLAFDERWEVCVWPGSLPNGAPCTGSSEIAPVPRSHYQCPNQEGYYADPENCRWFFACLDHARDGITPLTAYEFRCPFGLVFNQEKLACDWPWIVGACGNRGAAGYVAAQTVGSSTGIHSSTFINGGNLEASFGQYSGFGEGASFDSFGRGFGKVLKGSNGNYQGAQSAGFGYIASQFDDTQNRAPFATVPDYEISGGRILNKGGVVLDQHVNFGNGANGGASGFGGGYRYQSLEGEGGFGGKSSSSNTHSIVGGQRLGSYSKTPIVQSLGGNGKGENIVLSTPRPFSVHVPSVQINEENFGEYSVSTPASEVSSGAASFGGGISQSSTLSSKVNDGTLGLAVTQPTVSVVTPKFEIQTPSQGLAGQTGGFSFSTPSPSYSSTASVTPKYQVHRFGQSKYGSVSSTSLPTISDKDSSSGIAFVTPQTVSQGYQYSSTGLGGGLDISKSGLDGGSVSSGVHISQPAFTVTAPAGSGFGSGSTPGTVFPATSLKTAIPSVQNVLEESHGDLRAVNPTVSTGSFTSSGVFSGSTPATVTGGISSRPAVQTFQYVSGKTNDDLDLVHPAVSVANPSISVSSPGYPQSTPATVVSVSSTPQTNIYKSSGFGVSVGQSVSPVVTPKPSVYSFEQTKSFGIQKGYGSGGSITSGFPKSFGGFEQSSIDQEISRELGLNKPVSSYGVPAVTSKAQVRTFESTGSGSSEFSGSVPVVANTVSLVTPKPQVFASSQPTVFSGSKSTFSYEGSVTPKTVTAGTFNYQGGVASSGPALSVNVPAFTPKTLTSFENTKISSGYTPLATHDFSSQNIQGNEYKASGSNVNVNFPKFTTSYEGSKFGQEAGVAYGVPVVTPKVTGISQAEEVLVNAPGVVFNSPTATPKISTTFGSISSNQGSGYSYKAPTVTSGQGLSSLGESISLSTTPKTVPSIVHSGTVGVSYSSPQVTPKTVTTAFDYNSNGISSTTPSYPSSSSYFSSFGQTQSGKVEIPSAFPKAQINTFGQQIVHEGGQGSVSYGLPVSTNSGSFGFNQPSGAGFSDIKVNQVVQPQGGQGSSYSTNYKSGSQYSSSVQSFDSFSQSPRPVNFGSSGKSDILTEISIEKQPVVSVGTISSVNFDQGLSTPKPFSSSSFASSPEQNQINFKSSYSVQPKQILTVTTPAPVVSITPSTQVFFKSTPQPPAVVKSVSAVPFGQEGFGGAPKVAVEQINFNQNTKGFSSVSTPSTFQGQSNAYLPPVTPKVNVFAPKTQVSQSVGLDQSFGTFGEQQSVPLQPDTKYSFNFGKTQFKTQVQVPLSSGTFTPGSSQQTVSVTTGKPLSEFSSGGEFNSFFESTKTYLPPVQPTTAKPDLVFQQQPVQLISQKTFGQKQYIQPFYEQTLNVDKQNSISGFEQQDYSFGTGSASPKTGIFEQKQYVSPVAFTTVKPTTLQQPAVYNEKVQTIVSNVNTFGGQDGSRAKEYLSPVSPVAFTTVKPTTLQQPAVYDNKVQTVVSNINTFGEQDSFRAKEYLPPVTQKQYVSPVAFTTVRPTTVQQPAAFDNKVQSVVSNINTFGGQDSFRSNEFLSPVTQKQYVSPVAFTTVKPTTLQQSAVYGEKVQSVVSNINAFGGQDSFRAKEYLPPVTPKQYVSPVAFTTVKPTTFQQPAVYDKVQTVVSNVNAFGGQDSLGGKDYLPPVNAVKQPGKTVFVQQPQVPVGPQDINLLYPVTTQAPVTPLTEEVSIQQNSNFDFQKVRNGQSIFIQPGTYSTPKTSVFFPGSNQNFTFASGFKYSINPNIAIPEPPQEYLLAQNIYTTRRPIGRVNVYKSSTTPPTLGDYKAPTYLPPGGSQRTSSKSTLISVGSANQHEDNIQQLLDKYSAGFGDVVSGNNDFVTKVINGEGRGELEFGREGSSSTVSYEVTTAKPRQRSRGRQYHGKLTSSIPATNKYEEYEIEKEGQRSIDATDSTKTTIDLKNLKVDKDKKTVIVVSQVSDANPILIGKLAGQCSCQSNMLEVKGKGRKSGRGKAQGYQQPPANEYLPPNQENIPETVVIGNNKLDSGVTYQPEQSIVSSTTAVYPDVSSPSILSSLSPDGVLPITPKSLFSENGIKNKKTQFRGKTRYLPPTPGLSADGIPLSPVLASDIASTVDYSGDESRTQNEIGGGYPGAAFDRYGPGGWRGFDETLQGSVDCKRPGLFRHPKYCNKFYACNYDPWKERYTLHVFNCPIHLTYDSSISACNWPIRGPACADDNLLV